jgi:hypothetical protein
MEDSTEKDVLSSHRSPPGSNSSHIRTPLLGVGIKTRNLWLRGVVQPGEI